MIVHETSNYSRQFEKLVKRDSNLGQIVEKKLQLLVADRNYPGLRVHKIEGKHGSVWSLSVDLKLRILFGYVEDGIILFDIGSHDEVY